MKKLMTLVEAKEVAKAFGTCWFRLFKHETKKKQKYSIT